MITEIIYIKRSYTTVIWGFFLYAITLLVIIFFLTDFLLLLIGFGVFLLAVCAQVYDYLFQRKLLAIALITTKTAKQVNICINNQWLDNITIMRSMTVLGCLYLEFTNDECQHFKKIGFWLFKRNFVDEIHRRKLLQFLILFDR